MSSTSITFSVNRRKYSVSNNITREMTLNTFIRNVLALPGTKSMCNEGGCGACIVTVKAKRQTSGMFETFSVNSCLVLICSCHGWEVTTVEGLGNRLKGYDEIQKRFAAFNATQCGYCTPGWVMQLNSLKENNLTMAEMEKCFGCNTCRCTGYRPIMDTVKSFAVDANPVFYTQDMEDLFVTKNQNRDRRSSARSTSSDWSIISDFKDEEIITLDFGNTQFYKVYMEDEIFDILNRYGEDSYMLVDGNTSKGLFENFEYPRIIIDISDIKSLKRYYFDQNLILGANISIEDSKTLFEEISSKNEDFNYLGEFAKHLDLVAHIPIRKIGSLAGNLITKHFMPSYQSDIFLLFTSVGAIITLRCNNGEKINLSMLEFLKYDIQGKLMINIKLPPLSKTHIFRSYKIMPRHQNALALVNAAFLMKLNNDKIEEVNIVYGNISPNFNHATLTEQYLEGKNIFTNKTLQSAIKVLSQEISPDDNPLIPSSECRKKLAIGLFYKLILDISPPRLISPKIRSGGQLLTRPTSVGSQDFQTDKSLYPLNQPVPKYEALIQSAGEAQYANDIPPIPREVFGAFVLSTIHVGEIDEVSEDVLNIDGVIAIYTATDIPGKNSFIVPGLQLESEDEEILASGNIKYYGQPVAVVVAETQELAINVAKKVKVAYKNVSSALPILTINDAKLDSKRYTPYENIGLKPKGKGTDVTKIIKGVYQIEGQYPYYMEPITSVVIPIDKGLEVYDSSQWMDLIQIATARCLGLQEGQISVKIRRVGGGFGGKLTRNAQATTACALVAYKLDRPCRFILPLQTNMAIVGKRLPCQCDYEVGVNDEGKIQYLNATIIEDAGCSHNENTLPLVIKGFPNCYNYEYFDVKTATVLTDTASNTFVRAPGSASGIAAIEHIMENIAFTIQKDPTAVRIANMTTKDNDLPKLIKDLHKDSDYEERVNKITKFNQANRWIKKSIKTSVMYYPAEYMGNYSAMVSIYQGDGTVTITTGGVEMGQGVNTKAAQVCAYELGIPLENVSVLPMYSFVCANNNFSANSLTSESVCYAIIKACEILTKRLQPIKEMMDNPTWENLIQKAGKEEIDLTAIYMMNDKDESLSSYNAFSVAILEVELDVLTGRYEIIRVDILEDVGLSANPNIDIGQIEGAFIQGMGYNTTEKFVYDKSTGKLLTNRSLNYHVPLCLDIPADFRVKLRYNFKNRKGVLGSKMVGEMGICTATVINHALRQCIWESRKDSGYDGREWINIDLPYDTESILKALDVKLDEMVFK